MKNIDSAAKEKKQIAFTSVLAAIFLTLFKLLVGISTGSLGILSEALHSGLDLVAACVTFFAVRISDEPADSDHHYGHGKIENYSALIETILLLLTCIWIIYEAVERITKPTVTVQVTVWSFVVMLVSIVVDFSRSKALMKVAKKYNSQALEADAVHFSTDILSSIVVIAGLIGSYFSFHIADPLAALGVAAIVIYITYNLGKKSYNALVDKAPDGLKNIIEKVIEPIKEVKCYHNLKIRESGPYIFVELNIHVDKKITIEEAHKISHLVEHKITKEIQNCTVTVHAEPDVSNDF